MHIRPRRLRNSISIRRAVAETNLSPRQLVLPVFVAEGISEPKPISAMPGVVQHTLATLPALLDEVLATGIGGIMLFGVPTTKDATGSQADAPDGILNQAIATCLNHVGNQTLIMADLCLDEFTDHGHCGVLDAHGAVDNDATLERYAAMALAQARAGAHILGLSGMMDGQVATVRQALDNAGFNNTLILSYSAKYASSFYGPFREAVDSTLEGDRRTYQIDPRNLKAGLLETQLDIEQGADIVMVKPALAYLDVLHQVSETSPVPVAAYQVSGEYSMIEAASQNGWIDRDATIVESLRCIARAGADLIFTYWALEFADRLQQD